MPEAVGGAAWRVAHQARWDLLRPMLGGDGMTLLALAILSTIPQDFCVRERVEIIEVNNVFTLDGEPHLKQLVFWDANGRCLAWRMFHQGRQYWSNGAMYFADGDAIRCITARTVVESWTMFDIETADREYLPANERRELKQAKGR
jgi:hypothetical protein